MACCWVTLAEQNVGGSAKEWRHAAKTRWSKFGSKDYEQVIALIRRFLKSDPFEDRRVLRGNK